MIVEIVPLAAGQDAAGRISSLMPEPFRAEFDIDVRLVDRIDWGASYRRLVFRCDI